MRLRDGKPGRCECGVNMGTLMEGEYETDIFNQPESSLTV